jgi:predicted RNA-binding protein with TRAM domain
MPISDLKQQPVKPGEEVVVEVTDIHESGAGVGRTDDGFIVLVDGLLPDARAVVRIDRVKNNHATSKVVVERLPMDGEGEDGDGDVESPEAGEPSRTETSGRPEALGSRDNFWGG